MFIPGNRLLLVLPFVAAIGCGSTKSGDRVDAAFVVSPISGATTELGAQATFTIALSTEPKADVTLSLVSSNPSEGTVSPLTVTFTSTDFGPRTVTVSGIDDLIEDGNVLYQVQFSAIVTTDSRYQSLSLPEIPVTNVDDDIAQVFVSHPTGSTSETGLTATFQVVLGAQPASNVTLDFVIDLPGEAFSDVSSLTFTPSDYGTPKTVTLTGINDLGADGNATYHVVFSPVASGDPAYAGIKPQPMAVVNVDNDGPNSTPIVLVVAASSYSADTRAKLAAMSDAFPKVDLFDANAGTPTLLFLKSYDAILVFSDSPFADPVALGDVVADYFDAGGRVVVAPFANASVAIQGRYGTVANGYMLINPSGQANPTVSMGAPIEPGSPLLAEAFGITAVYGFRSTGSPINGGVAILLWNDGAPLVVRGYAPNGRLHAALNFYPPSIDARSDFWSGDGDKLLRNALRYDGMLFEEEGYSAARTFTDSLPGSTVSLAWDGTNLWTASGGNTSGNRLARFDSIGRSPVLFAPGFDFRSLFTKGDGVGPVYARSYASRQILVQTSPGVFANSTLLSVAPADAQSSVVFDSLRNEFVAMSAGVLQRWNSSGAYLGSVTLDGFGTQGTEGEYPQNRGIMVSRGLYLTYSDGVVSAWAGTRRVKTAALAEAGTTFDSYVSASYSQGKLWIVDQAGSTWRGYDLGM